MTISHLFRRALALVLAWALAPVAMGETPRESAEQLFAAADELQTQRDYPPALEQYDRALALWVESGDLDGQAKTLLRMGVVQRRLGAAARAVELCGKALALFRQIGDRAGEADALTVQGLACDDLGRLQAARAAYEAAIALKLGLGLFLEQDVPLRNLGNTLLQLGESTAAREAFEDARELARLTGDPFGESRSLNGIARCRLALGETVQAIETFETILALSRQTGDVELEIGALNNLSDVYRRQGNLSAALKHLFAANELRRQLGQKALIADGLQNLGTLYVALGQLRQALARYQDALELYTEVGKPSGAALARLSVSWVRLAEGEVPAAVAELERLHDEQRAASDPKLATEVARALGVAYLAARRPGSAQKLFEQALARGRELDDFVGVARSLTGLGEAQAALGENARARASFSEALALGTRLGNPAIEATSLRGLARLERDRDALEEALTLAEQALERVERGRQLVPTAELRATFLARQQDFYELRLDLLLLLHQRHPDRGFDVHAFEASERARARGLLDLLTERGEDTGTPREPVFAERERALDEQRTGLRRELDSAAAQRRADLERQLSKIEDDIQQLEVESRRDASLYSELRYGSTARLDEVQQLLEPKSALVEYALGQESSLGFVVTREKVHSFKIPATAEEIKKQVEELRGVLRNPGRLGLGTYRRAAWSLYELLLGPAEASLAGVGQLIVVPDRSLHTLPFEVLLTAPPDASAGLETLPYLLKKPWSVSYAPSASVLRLLRRPRGEPASGLVVFADPSYTGADLVSLPASAAEARAIAALYPPEQSRLFLGAKANKNNVKNDPWVRKAKWLHFATHGWLDERWPQLSALELSRGQNDDEDGRLYVYEISRLDLAAELVVLSACETALGQEVRGEGLIGLTRAFLYAGASRVAVSLWPVRDAATADLMPRFYRHLEDHPSTAAALRAAKLELVREGRFAHPSYWASFILIGRP